MNFHDIACVLEFAFGTVMGGRGRSSRWVGAHFRSNGSDSRFVYSHFLNFFFLILFLQDFLSIKNRNS